MLASMIIASKMKVTTIIFLNNLIMLYYCVEEPKPPNQSAHTYSPVVVNTYCTSYHFYPHSHTTQNNIIYRQATAQLIVQVVSTKPYEKYASHNLLETAIHTPFLSHPIPEQQQQQLTSWQSAATYTAHWVSFCYLHDGL